MNFWILLLFLMSNAAVYLVSIPLVRKRVKPNGLYGFRTPKTLSSERIWYAANRDCGQALMASSAVGSVALVLCWIVVRGPAFVFWATVISLVGLGLALAYSFAKLARMR